MWVSLVFYPSNEKQMGRVGKLGTQAKFARDSFIKNLLVYILKLCYERLRKSVHRHLIILLAC